MAGKWNFSFNWKRNWSSGFSVKRVLSFFSRPPPEELSCRQCDFWDFTNEHIVSLSDPSDDEIELVFGRCRKSAPTVKIAVEIIDLDRLVGRVVEEPNQVVNSDLISQMVHRAIPDVANSNSPIAEWPMTEENDWC